MVFTVAAFVMLLGVMKVSMVLALVRFLCLRIHRWMFILTVTVSMTHVNSKTRDVVGSAGHQKAFLCRMKQSKTVKKGTVCTRGGPRKSDSRIRCKIYT